MAPMIVGDLARQAERAAFSAIFVYFGYDSLDMGRRRGLAMVSSKASYTEKLTVSFSLLSILQRVLTFLRKAKL